MRAIHYFFLSVLSVHLITDCNQNVENMENRTFRQDLELILAHDPDAQLLQDRNGESMLIVSPKYQGKVFTSSTGGKDALSLGWVNEEAIRSDQLDSQINAYGGENRMWIGPEGSRFSVFFEPGSSFDFSNWKTPAAIDHEAWTLDKADSKEVWMSHHMQIQNKQGTRFHVGIKRIVSLVGPAESEQMLRSPIPEGVGLTAYQTLNSIRNEGDFKWTRETGALCIWVLDMFVPSDKTIIMVPYNRPGDETGNPVTADYFGEIPADRLQMHSDMVFLKADGKSRGKIGVSGRNARPWAASYDAENNIFTYVSFELDTGAVYLNQEWNDKKDPFSGDAVNAYNDGPLEHGDQLGPFYELESSSPAAFLAPGEELAHRHTIFHFSGTMNQLDPLVHGLTGYHIREISGKL